MNLLQRWRLASARRRCRLPLQAGVLAQPLPARAARVAGLELVALDFETTGLDIRHDHIIAAGWVLLRADRIILGSARELRVRHDAPAGVGQSAVIHGIVDSDLADADDAMAMLETLLPVLAGRAIVAHAAAIERGFLATLLQGLGGVAPPNPFIDTLALERRLLEGRGGRAREGHDDLTLAGCRARRQLPTHRGHSAGADALACAELLLAQIEELGGAGRVRLRELC